MKLREPEIDVIEPSRAAPVKFLHASGSRPLEGYTIKRGVGRGGFGEVYFATSDAGKEVALKLIRRNLEVELRGVTHCLNLKHPNLVALYDIRTDEMGDQWVVMEYVCGESLEQAIERHPDGMPIDEAMWWMRGICAGVGYLHDHGIVHRDLKPGNIFLDEGTVKIGDYGLSKFISCSRRSGQTESVGTVHYMAPEIANGRYGREIDTYALGVMLYEMLTGHVPFEGESVGEVLMKHLTAEPSIEGVPKPFQKIVARALAKDPEVRFASVNELLEVLPGAKSPSPQGPPSAAVQYPGVGRVSRDEYVPASQLTPLGQSRTQSDVVPEPIAKAIGEGIQHLTKGWQDWSANPIAKTFVALGLLIALVVTSWGWLSIAFTGLFLYCLYYPIWAWVIRPTMRAPEPAAPSSERPTIAAQFASSSGSPQANWHEQAADRKRRRKSWREQALHEVAAKPLRDKASELLGSMLLSGVISVTLAAIVSVVFSGGPVSSTGNDFAQFLWLAAISTLGCWGILGINKWTEGRIEDQVPNRTLQLALGVMLGLVGSGICALLWLGLPVSRDIATRPGDSLAGEFFHWNQGQYWNQYSSGMITPNFAMAVGYFALLFVALRWWRLAEYTRRVRVSIWSIAWCGLAAWLLQFVWWFPQPTGLFVAAIVATATQLASPWMPPSRRRELAARAVA